MQQLLTVGWIVTLPYIVPWCLLLLPACSVTQLQCKGLQLLVANCWWLAGHNLSVVHCLTTSLLSALAPHSLINNFIFFAYHLSDCLPRPGHVLYVIYSCPLVSAIWLISDILSDQLNYLDNLHLSFTSTITSEPIDNLSFSPNKHLGLLSDPWPTSDSHFVKIWTNHLSFSVSFLIVQWV